MTERVLLGPFYTLAKASRRAFRATDEVRIRPDLLRIGGRRTKEAYFAFQFDGAGIRSDVGSAVLALRGVLDDLAIADWLVRPNSALSGDSPLLRMNRRGGTAEVLAVVADRRAVIASSNQWRVEEEARQPPEPGRSHPMEAGPRQRPTPSFVKVVGSH